MFVGYWDNNVSKYDPLLNGLMKESVDRVPMEFADIEAILGFKLPASSRIHRAWWSNNPDNNVMTKAWLSAGFETESVDLGAERLVFRRINGTQRDAVSMTAAGGGRGREKASVVGILAGSVMVSPGDDLTVATDERWDAEA